MTNRTPSPDTDQDSTPGSIPIPTTSAPRWVKITGAIVLGLAVLLVGLKLTGAGPNHGPGRHGGAGERTETSGPPGGQTKPAGAHTAEDRP